MIWKVDVILTFSKKHCLKTENMSRITKIDSKEPHFVFAWKSKMRQNLHGMSTLPKDAVDAEAYQNSTFCVPNMFWVNYL